MTRLKLFGIVVRTEVLRVVVSGSQVKPKILIRHLVAEAEDHQEPWSRSDRHFDTARDILRRKEVAVVPHATRSQI